MTEEEQLKGLTKNQKAFLSRHSCGWCNLPLHRSGCGAIYDKCTEEDRIGRRERCLKGYRPRGKQNV